MSGGAPSGADISAVMEAGRDNTLSTPLQPAHSLMGMLLYTSWKDLSGSKGVAWSHPSVSPSMEEVW